MLLLARNSLKEDTFIIMVHTLLLWILVGLLVGWMLAFTLLACSPIREKTPEHEASATLPTQAAAKTVITSTDTRALADKVASIT